MARRRSRLCRRASMETEAYASGAMSGILKDIIEYVSVESKPPPGASRQYSTFTHKARQGRERNRRLSSFQTNRPSRNESQQQADFVPHWFIFRHDRRTERVQAWCFFFHLPRALAWTVCLKRCIHAQLYIRSTFPALGEYIEEGHVE